MPNEWNADTTESFDLEMQVGGQWKEIAEGKTIGDERVLHFPPIKVRLFRLNLRKTKGQAVLLDFQLFGNDGLLNLSRGKPVEVLQFLGGDARTNLSKTHITDGDGATIWAAEPNARAAWVTVDLQKEREISEAMLSDVPYGRTQQFDLEAQVGGQWKKLAGGATIGNRLDLSLVPVKARRFRLNIRKASDTPTLAEFQLYGE